MAEIPQDIMILYRLSYVKNWLQVLQLSELITQLYKNFLDVESKKKKKSYNVLIN